MFYLWSIFSWNQFWPIFWACQSQFSIVSSDGKFLRFSHCDIWHFYDRKSYQTNHVFPTSSRYTVIPNDMIIRSPLPHRKSQPQSSFLFRTFYAGAGCRLKLSHPKKTGLLINIDRFQIMIYLLEIGKTLRFSLFMVLHRKTQCRHQNNSFYE